MASLKLSGLRALSTTEKKEALKALHRKDLQVLAKELGAKANAKTLDMVHNLLALLGAGPDEASTLETQGSGRAPSEAGDEEDHHRLDSAHNEDGVKEPHPECRPGNLAGSVTEPTLCGHTAPASRAQAGDQAPVEKAQVSEASSRTLRGRRRDENRREDQQASDSKESPREETDVRRIQAPSTEHIAVESQATSKSCEGAKGCGVGTEEAAEDIAGDRTAAPRPRKHQTRKVATTASPFETDARGGSEGDKDGGVQRPGAEERRTGPRVQKQAESPLVQRSPCRSLGPGANSRLTPNRAVRQTLLRSGKRKAPCDGDGSGAQGAEPSDGCDGPPLAKRQRLTRSSSRQLEKQLFSPTRGQRTRSRSSGGIGPTKRQSSMDRIMEVEADLWENYVHNSDGCGPGRGGANPAAWPAGRGSVTPPKQHGRFPEAAGPSAGAATTCVHRGSPLQQLRPSRRAHWLP